MVKLEITPREKNLIIIALGLIIPLLLYVYVIAPVWSEYQLNSQELAKAEKRLTDLQKMAKDTSIQRQTEELKSKIMNQQLSIPMEPATHDFLYMLNIAAIKSGITPDHIEFKVAPGDNLGIAQLGMVNVDMILKGEYAGFRSFLGQLEHFERANVVKSFTLKQETTLTGYVRIEGFMYPINLPDLNYKSVVPPNSSVGKIDPFKS